MNNFYCAAPWRSLHINARGDVKTCCAGNPNMLGNLSSQGIEEILNGPKLKEIRSSIRLGQSHEYCSNCVNRENLGGDSERSWHNSVNESFDYLQAGLDYEFPTLIDVRWNSTCNLSCNYCGPLDSSKWASLRKIPVATGTRHYYIDVCNFLEKHYDHIQEVALVGGEPLLLPENNRLLDVIPPDCIVTLITNLNTPLEKNPIFQKLAQRQNVGWSISFENLKERFEYVRHGASWELMLHNLDIIQGLMKNNGHWGGIHAVYNLYNATHLCELTSFAQQQELYIKWQILNSPNALNIRSFGNEVAKLAAKEIENLYANFVIDQQDQNMFDSALQYYRSMTDSTTPCMRNKLKIFVEEIESFHNNSGEFARLWPEFGELLWPQNQH